MPWLRLKLQAGGDHADAFAAALEEVGAVSVTLADAGDEPMFDTQWERTPIWSQVQVIALFPDATDVPQLIARVSERLGLDPPTYEIDVLHDQDWANSWKAHYQPLMVGHNLWVCPSWCTPPVPEAVNIVLDPGLAFGTGTHPTTALCLEWLSQQDLRDTVVLDYGCGSGILAIAALRLGARAAIATDVDAQALAVTRENAALNGVAHGLKTALPAALPVGLTTDIVVANILASPLMELAPTLTAHVRSGGVLALSGLLADQANDVAGCYRPAFSLNRRDREGWALLTGRKC